MQVKLSIERLKSLKGWIFWFIFCMVLSTVLSLWHFSSLKNMNNIIGRELTYKEMAEITKRNSPMTDYIYLTPNADFPRGDSIKKITIHHMAGNLDIKRLGKDFASSKRQASSNYAVDSSGRIALYVEERNRAWTSSSKENDDQAVTIEVANDETGGDWHVSDESYDALIELCVDICIRNDIERLVYTGDSTGNLTIHKMFSRKTQCPGPYLESRMGEIADEVNERLDESR